MKVEIHKQKFGGGFAKGNDKSGNEYFVIGGDLCYGDTIDVEKCEGKENLWINRKVNYSNIEVFAKHFDKDGLIEFTKLKEVTRYSKPNKRVYELEGYWVFVEKRIQNQVEFLYDKELIDSAKIKITKSWTSHFFRAPVYGLNYSNLLNKVIENCESISSWFICNREKSFNEGVYADLFIIGNFNENDLQIQLWQIIDEGSEVLFAHGLIDRETMKFKHLDLASHYIDPMIIPKFLSDKQRMELKAKKKWIRIDGEINREEVFDMIKMFFPLDYLIDEFVEYKTD